MNEGRPGVCWYCGEPALRIGDPTEHIIPAAIQGTLTTNRVCKPCNQNAARLDQKFLQDYFVALERSEHEMPDRYGKQPPHPKAQAKLKDGTPVRINTRGGQWRAEVFPKVRENLDGSFTVSAATEEEALRKIEELTREAGVDATFTIKGIEKREIPSPDVEVTLRVSAVVALRMAAKMALGTLSLVWGEEWLASGDAKRLQGWWQAASPTNEAGQGLSAVLRKPPDYFALLCRPPGHLLILQGAEAEEQTRFAAVLFGSQMIALAVARGGQPQQDTVWVMDGEGGKTEQMPVWDLVARRARPEPVPHRPKSGSSET